MSQLNNCTNQDTVNSSIITESATPFRTGIGSGALVGATGVDNTAVGYNCLSSGNAFTYNTAVGFGAMSGVSASCTSNCAVGVDTLTTGGGTYNCAMGVLAGNTYQGSNSVIIGDGALTSGSSNCNGNIAIGSDCMETISSGSNSAANNCIGYQCAMNLKTGSFNNLLGYLAGSSYTSSESSNILISNTGVIAENNTIRIGTQGTGSGQQNQAFIAGITGVTGLANAVSLTLNSSTGQIGTMAQSFNSVNVQTFTSSGTYTPTTGMKYAIIEAVGGGGDGGGSQNTSATQFSCAGGGGSGGYAYGVFTASTIGASQTVTIGALGSGGSAGGTGGTGGTTSVGSLIQATGGSGGFSGTVNNFSAGGTAGTGTTGSFLLEGQSGDGGIGYAPGMVTYFVKGGGGGNTKFGSGGAQSFSFAGTGIAGNAGTGYGSGGGGSSVSGAVSGLAGGNGTAGLVFITEYCAI